MPSAPATDDATNQTRVMQERQKAINASGLSGTIITGGLGASDYASAGTTKGTTLLGQTG